MQELLSALCGDTLAECWKTVLDQVGVASVQDMEEMGETQLQRLRESHHDKMAEVLEMWQAIAVLLREAEHVEQKKKASAALESLLQYAHEDSEGWVHVSGNDGLLDDITVSSLVDEGGQRLFRASALIRQEADIFSSHLWSRNTDTDACMIAWTAGDTYQLRRQTFPLLDPLVDRETYVIRLQRRINETTWAMASVSVELNHPRFAASQDKSVRANIALDGFVVTSVAERLTRVTRVSHFDACGDLGDQSAFLGVFNPVLKGEWRVSMSLQDLKTRSARGQLLSARKLLGVGVAGAATGAVVAPVAATTALSALGFGTTGIAASSAAAGIMSGAAVANGGAIAAGSSVAALQAAGATGSILALGAAPVAAIVVGGAALIGGVGIGAYFLGRFIKKQVDKKQRIDRVLNSELHLCEVCDNYENARQSGVRRADSAEQSSVRVSGPHCDQCGTTESEQQSMMQCSRCNAVCYCGRRCQKRGWKEHKKVCSIRSDT